MLCCIVRQARTVSYLLDHVGGAAKEADAVGEALNARQLAYRNHAILLRVHHVVCATSQQRKCVRNSVSNTLLPFMCARKTRDKSQVFVVKRRMKRYLGAM